MTPKEVVTLCFLIWLVPGLICVLFQFCKYAYDTGREYHSYYAEWNTDLTISFIMWPVFGIYYMFWWLGRLRRDKSKNP